MATTRSVTADDLSSAQPVQVVANEQLKPDYQRPINMVAERGTVIRLRRVQPPSATEIMAAYSQKQATLKSNEATVDDIANILKNFYHAESADPATIQTDLTAMAAYYGRYPQALALINALRDQKLQLKYRASTWQTQARGNQYGVDSATIYFDTRLGAQLLNDPGCEATPACSISPADALLHELLHAKMMLLDSQHFIDVGGMEHTLYPFEHEREVIDAENQLYSAMNQLDGLARPIRHRHSGELLQVACPLCNPIRQLAAIGPSL